MQGTSAQILETRKTAPGLRLTDKWAVLIGGGTNHRIGLFDMVMIKDNHVTAAGGVVSAIQHAQVQHMLEHAPCFALAALTWSKWRATLSQQLMGRYLHSTGHWYSTCCTLLCFCCLHSVVMKGNNVTAAGGAVSAIHHEQWWPLLLQTRMSLT